MDDSGELEGADQIERKSSSSHFLVFVNVFFLLWSFMLLTIGTIFQTSLNGDYSLFRGHLSSPTLLLIAFAVFLYLSSLLALLSVYCRSPGMLSVHIFTVTVLIIAELAVGIACFRAKSHVLNSITSSMRSAESKYTSNRFVSATVDSIQRDFKCCGVDNYYEWFQYLGNSSLPDSCCFLYTVDCGEVALKPPLNFHNTGCASAVAYWADKKVIPVAVLFSFTLILQIWSILCSKRNLRNPHQSSIFKYRL